MSSEYYHEPDTQKRQPSPTSERWGPWEIAEMRTQPLANDPPSPAATLTRPPAATAARAEEQPLVDPQFSHREHVTGSLASHPADAPLFRPAYSPYPPVQPSQPQQGQGYASQPVYPGYPYYPMGYVPYARHPAYAQAPYVWQAPQPRRDGYLLGIAIASVVGSSLALLAGLGLAFLLLLVLVVAPQQGQLSGQNGFESIAVFTTLICVGLLGGGSGLYHSIRSLMRKPSAHLWLPGFWVFLVLYLVVLGVAFLLQSRGQEVAFPALSILLILLAGIFPALTVGALGARRLRSRVKKPGKALWPTSWRRFMVALVSGSTSGISIALLLELGLLALLAAITHIQGVQNPVLCVDTPDAQSCQNPGTLGFVLIIVSVIAPLVEESVKPLAVVVLIGRVRSAAEAFVLGLACGIGFDLVETTLYISSGYHDWLSVALLRTGAGLLHGFGAAMVALGWYYLVKERSPLRAFACWLYAVLQHAIWNGSWALILLPAPAGPALQNWTLNLGTVALPGFALINISEAVFMLIFFIYIAGKLRPRPAIPPQSPSSQHSGPGGIQQPVRAAAV